MWLYDSIYVISYLKLLLLCSIGYGGRYEEMEEVMLALTTYVRPSASKVAG
jgi:hypothetical protein